MSEHLIDNHPLDELDTRLYIGSILDAAALQDDERRYVAEHKTAQITGSSSLESCAEALAWLTAAHIPQINARLKDIQAVRHYSNPVELISEESKRRENKQIGYTGNIDRAHKRIKALDKQIVSEETPDEMKKTLGWAVVFIVVSLALGVFSVITGAGVNAVTWLLNTKLAYWLVMLAIVGLCLFFGFLSIGVLLAVGLYAISWLLSNLPWLSAVLVNGVLFLVAGLSLPVAMDCIQNIKNYKPLTEEEHRLNQERIAEKEALCQELKEYSELMESKLDIMKDKFLGNSTAFINAMQKVLGGTYDYGAVSEVFSFFRKYYKKMKK